MIVTNICIGVFVLAACIGDAYGSLKYKREIKGFFQSAFDWLIGIPLIIIYSIALFKSENGKWKKAIVKTWDTMINKRD